MTIHILPIARAVPRITAETHSLFLAREAIAAGSRTPTVAKVLERLCRSDNAAIREAAQRLQGEKA